MQLCKRFFIFALCTVFLPLFVICCNRSEVMGEHEISEAVREVKDKFARFSNENDLTEAFLFFTDPHLLGGENEYGEKEKEKLVSSFALPKAVYDTLPLSFCLCGGDWLNQRETREVAKEKLLYVDKYLNSLFPQYYKMMGNHDTNYLGIVSKNDL